MNTDPALVRLPEALAAMVGAIAEEEGIVPDAAAAHMIALGIEVWRDEASGLRGRLADCHAALAAAADEGGGR